MYSDQLEFSVTLNCSPTTLWKDLGTRQCNTTGNWEILLEDFSHDAVSSKSGGDYIRSSEETLNSNLPLGEWSRALLPIISVNPGAIQQHLVLGNALQHIITSLLF